MCPSMPAASSRLPVRWLHDQRAVGQRRRGVFRRIATADDLGRHDHVDQRAERMPVRRTATARPTSWSDSRRPAPPCSSPGAGTWPSRRTGTWRGGGPPDGAGRSPGAPWHMRTLQLDGAGNRTRIAASSRARSSASCRRWPWRRRPRARPTLRRRRPRATPRAGAPRPASAPTRRLPPDRRGRPDRDPRYPTVPATSRRHRPRPSRGRGRHRARRRSRHDSSPRWPATWSLQSRRRAGASRRRAGGEARQPLPARSLAPRSGAFAPANRLPSPS